MRYSKKLKYKLNKPKIKPPANKNPAFGELYKEILTGKIRKKKR